MAFDFDHDAFLADDFCGHNAIYTPAGGLAKSVRVAFSLGAEEINLGGDILPQMIAGKAGCKAADVEGAKLNDTLEAEGVIYRILKVEIGETGWATLYLGKRYE